mmetsp:Transcript_23944/g.70537  ORF Transcript_23944/g.70537 Transcript_23944/m.70537 type:complete len:248 (+) Transcript_23944:448-1191(+)
MERALPMVHAHAPLWTLVVRVRRVGQPHIRGHIRDHGCAREGLPHVWQRDLRFFHGRLPQPAHRLAGPENVRGDTHLVDAALLPDHLVRRLHVRGAWHGVVAHALPLPRALPLRQRVHEGRGVHPHHLGHLLREERLDAHLLELRGRALRVLLPVRLPVQGGRAHRAPPRLHRHALRGALLRLLRLGHRQLAEEPLPDAAGGDLREAAIRLPAAAMADAQGPQVHQDGAQVAASRERVVGVRAQDPL